MNAIETLQAAVLSRFPGIQTELDKPSTATGSWWLDIDYKGLQGVVEWRKGRGFGLTVGRVDPMDPGADEIHRGLEQAQQRLFECLQNGKHTAPVSKGGLRELRAFAGLSQQELAEKLGISQAAVSKLEAGDDDIQLGTLLRFVRALGGDLELRAHFATRNFEIDEGSRSRKESA